MDEEENKGEDIEYRVRVLLIYQRCKYMIDDHKKKKKKKSSFMWHALVILYISWT